jgi:hypothetical protein
VRKAFASALLLFKRCDSTESDFCGSGWPLSWRAGAPPKEPKPPNDPFFSALPDSALLPCDQAEPDRCGAGAVSCERCDHDDPDFCGAGGADAEERLPNEPNDEFFDDVDRLLLVGLDFWEENPLLNELELELDRELELDDGFAAAVMVVAAGSSSASSNMI